jgi:hypothetical protein
MTKLTGEQIADAGDDGAPSFWVLADPDGNKVCLSTWQERDRSEP